MGKLIGSTPGQRLRAARRAAGISAADLAKRATALSGRQKPLSESAVRNQENGTNGIPLVLVDVYAEILGVSPRDIAFEEESSPDPDDLSGNELQRFVLERSEHYIECIGTVSGKWREPVTFSFDNEVGISAAIDGYDTVDLFCHRVDDDTLHPQYPRNSYIITIDAKKVDIFDGDHVVAYNFVDGILLESVRQIRDYDGLVVLHELDPLAKKKTILSDQGHLYKAFISRVVIGSLTKAYRHTASPISLPDGARTPKPKADSTKE